MKISNKAILINQYDNVATVLSEVMKNETIKITFNGQLTKTIQALDHIDAYHKVAVQPIDKGQEIIKYGEVIGIATQRIDVGNHVHINNIKGVIM